MVQGLGASDFWGFTALVCKRFESEGVNAPGTPQVSFTEQLFSSPGRRI